MAMMKVFYEIKNKVNGIRIDYYSAKTFCALKNSLEADLINFSHVAKKMFQNVMKQPRFLNDD